MEWWFYLAVGYPDAGICFVEWCAGQGTDAVHHVYMHWQEKMKQIIHVYIAPWSLIWMTQKLAVHNSMY